MLFVKKLNLNRFKRGTQGLIDFATLIEQADPSNRAKIMEQAETQDSDFLFRVMRKVVFFEELIYMDDTVLAEILGKTSPKILAHALHGVPTEFRDKMLSQIGFREKRLIKDEEEKMGTVTPSLILGAQKQVLKMARVLESQNKFTFELTTCPRFKTKRSKPVPITAAANAAAAAAAAEEAATAAELKLVKK